LPKFVHFGQLILRFYSMIASIKENFVPAAIAILVSGIFDGLDGVLPLDKYNSKFGAEYDSWRCYSFRYGSIILAYNWSLSIYGVGLDSIFFVCPLRRVKISQIQHQIGIIEARYLMAAIPCAAGELWRFT